MSDKQLENRVLNVLGDFSNGTITSDDQAWLDELLTTNVKVQNLYVDYMSMHASLHVEGAPLELQACGVTGESTDVTNPEVEQFEKGSVRSISGSLLAFLPALRKSPYLLAATLAGVALFASLATYTSITEKPALSAAVQSDTDALRQQVVARITGTQNCLWRQSTQPIGFGTELVIGQKLELREGLAEITFENGATMLLESPATFVVEASSKLALHVGRLAAVVPAESRGFRVHTRALDVYEVGSEFGLLVKQSGATEVHVFNGLVKANILDSSGRTLRQLVLNSKEAAGVNSVSTTVLEFPADETAFVRSMMSSSGPKDGLLVYEGFEYPEGPLSAQNGGFGWAGPWFDIAADDEAEPYSNTVGTGSLTARGLPPLGNHAAQTGHQNRIRRSLATSVGAVFDVAGLVENQDGVRLVGLDGNHIYLSFLQKASRVDDGFYGLELHRGDGNFNRVLSIGNGAEGTGYGATSIYNVYGPKNFPSLGDENTETNLFVIKISFGVDNHDIVEIYRNPESMQDESRCQVDATLKGNFSFDRISFANFDGSKIHEVDEVRLGTHFLAVTGRWGGERGRLLRRIAQQSRPAKVSNLRLLGLAQTAWFQTGGRLPSITRY